MATGTGTPYDLVVIGGGTAGLVGAKTAASLGGCVLLVERDRPGGDCLWTGCVPSKSLLAMAATTPPEGDRDANFIRAMRHIRGSIATIEPVDSFAALNAAMVETRHDEATFAGPGRLLVGGNEVRFRQALIATGAAPKIPTIPGLADGPFLTSETIWDLPALPRKLLVLGGGAISCELGQAFARLGAEVVLVTRSAHLLAQEDLAGAAIVQSSMAADGVRIVPQTVVRQVEWHSTSGTGHVILDSGKQVAFDTLLIALGRSPRTAGLNLASVGVSLDDRGYIQVDQHLQTSNPLVWAAGDVTSHSRFTHTAGVHASLAATNAMLGLRRSISPVVPRVTFTSPELAAVGASTDESRLENGHRLLEADHAHLDRAITDDHRSGFTKLVVNKRGRLVGATIVGPRAGESLAEVTLAISQGLRPRDLASVTHPYPTYNDAVWNAAIADVRSSLASGPIAKAIPVLRTIRARWVDLRQDRQERSR